MTLKERLEAAWDARRLGHGVKRVGWHPKGRSLDYGYSFENLDLMCVPTTTTPMPAKRKR